jgi:cytoskeletal protein RodZ
MSEKVVLPKFDLPGSGPHPAVRALWIVGGLLGVAMLVLGGAMWRHHAAQETAEQEAKARVAAQLAEADAATQAAKAKTVAKNDSKTASKTETAATKSAPVAGATTSATPTVAAESHHHATSSKHHGASKAASKGNVLAKSDTHGKPAPLSKKKGDDAIDKLLASFK